MAAVVKCMQNGDGRLAKKGAVWVRGWFDWTTGRACQSQFDKKRAIVTVGCQCHYTLVLAPRQHNVSVCCAGSGTFIPWFRSFQPPMTSTGVYQPNLAAPRWCARQECIAVRAFRTRRNSRNRHPLPVCATSEYPLIMIGGGATAIREGGVKKRWLSHAAREECGSM
ncbi:hypothetical protein BKA81DRAFT_7322 [Phyllosticta paracitricarpa]